MNMMRNLKLRSMVKQLLSNLNVMSCKIQLSYGNVVHCNTDQNTMIIESIWPYSNPECIGEWRHASENREQRDLSLILPLYNSEHFIEKCISSLLNQSTSYNYEIICVNDGSQDNTGEILDELSETYPDKIVVVNQENGGISVARNTGIMVSKGRFLGFIDHDDYVEPDYVQTLLDTAYRTGSDIVKCGYDNNGLVSNVFKDKIIIDAFDYSFFDIPSYIWGGIYDAALFDQFRFPVGYWYEDLLVRGLLYRRSKKMNVISHVLYHKIAHKTNASTVVWTTKSPKCVEQLYLTQYLIKANSMLGLKLDYSLFCAVLKECSRIMVDRTSGLSDVNREQVFLAACETYETVYKKEWDNRLKGEWCLWSVILRERYYKLWKRLGRI